MSDETLSTGILIEAIEVVDQFLEQIHEKEQDCLRRIFLRYTIMKHVANPSFKNVVRHDFKENPNYAEWYYQSGKGKQPYLLMARKVVATAKDGVPEFRLDISFNGELVTNNEL